jgi:hypothetical protein
MSDISKADRQRIADALRETTREELEHIATFYASRTGSHTRLWRTVAALALAVVDQMDAAGSLSRWYIYPDGTSDWRFDSFAHPLPSAIADFITREGE